MAKRYNDQLVDKAENLRVALNGKKDSKNLVDDLANATSQYIGSPTVEHRAELENQMGLAKKFLRGLFLLAVIVLGVYLKVHGSL